jgi:hypothetical protein
VTALIVTIWVVVAVMVLYVVGEHWLDHKRDD